MPMEPCRECRTLDGSCRQFVIGAPDPVCIAGYRVSQPQPDDSLDMLDLLIPVPRRSPENVRVR